MVKLPKLFRATAPLLPQEVWVSRRGKWEAIQLRSQFQRRGERLLYISLVLRRRRVCRTLTLREGEATELLQALGIPAALIDDASHFGGSKIQCVDLQGSNLGRFEVVESSAGSSEQHAESCGGGEAAAAEGPPASHWCTAPPAVLQPAPTTGRQYAEAAIFWDYENISLSGQEDVLAVSSALRTMCSGMGCRLTERRLYMGDMHACGKAVRAELDQAGFTLVHCPRRGVKKEQVDKKIIIDVLMWAWERAARRQAACVVLVTNDGDYAYLLSKLRDLHTTTVVVYDANPASILLRACDAALPLRGGMPCGELPRPSIGAPSGTFPPPQRPHETPPPPPPQPPKPPQPQPPPQQQQPQLPLPDVEAAVKRTVDGPAPPHAQHTTKCSRARPSRLTSPRRRVDWPGV